MCIYIRATCQCQNEKQIAGEELSPARPSRARTCDHLIMSHEHLKYCFSREYTENIGILELHVIPNVCSEYSEHYFRDCQRVISKNTYPIAWNYYNLLPSHLVGNLAHLPEKPSVGGQVSKS